jgi:hypothetical protein
MAGQGDFDLIRLERMERRLHITQAWKEGRALVETDRMAANSFVG